MNYFHHTFGELGLNESDVDILLLLMQHAELSVPRMVKLSGYSRTTVYDSLNNLERYSLIESRKIKRDVFYRGVHPDRIRDIVDAKKRDTAMTFENMEKCVEEITQLYNTTTQIPGIDLLQTSRKMYTAIAASINEVPSSIQAILHSSIIKRFEPSLVQLFTSTEHNRQIIVNANPKSSKQLEKIVQSPSNTIVYVDEKKSPFDLSMLVLNNVTVYIKCTPQHSLLGYVVADPSITTLHHSLFHALWQNGQKI